MTEKKIFEKSANMEKKEFSNSQVINPNPRMTFLFLDFMKKQNLASRIPVDTKKEKKILPQKKHTSSTVAMFPIVDCDNGNTFSNTMVTKLISTTPTTTADSTKDFMLLDDTFIPSSPSSNSSNNLSTSSNSASTSSNSISTSSNTITIVEKQQIDEPCPICLGEIEKKTRLDCAHEFCYSCITMWMCNIEECPLCKKTIVPGYDIILENNQQDDGSTSEPSATMVSNSSFSLSSINASSSPPPTNSTQKLEDYKIYVCPAKRCGKSFIGQTLREHYKKEHGKSQCKYCITSVQTHLLKRHEGVCKKTAVLCPAQGCPDIVPKDARALILKEDSSSDQPFDYAEYSFVNGGAFLMATHDCQFVVKCNVCQLAFCDDLRLLQHCGVFHPDEINEAVPHKKRKSAAQCLEKFKDIKKMKKELKKSIRLYSDDEDDEQNVDEDLEPVQNKKRKHHHHHHRRHRQYKDGEYKDKHSKKYDAEL